MIVSSYSINKHFEDGDVSVDRLVDSLRACLGSELLSVSTNDDELSITTAHELSPEKAAAVKAEMAAHRVDKHHLPTAKALKYKAIDARTRELIDLGFEANGLRFSLSVGAQLKLLRLDLIRDALDFPVVFNTLDDCASYSIATPGALHEFVVQGLLRVHEIVEGGSDLKNLVRAAQTVADVVRIADPR
jgi:hypothetical protein